MGNLNGGSGFQGNLAGGSQNWFQALCVQNLLSAHLHMNSKWPKQHDKFVSLAFTLDAQTNHQTTCPSRQFVCRLV